MAAKRSYIDLFIDKLVPKDQAQITAAPVYWDYQAMLAYKPSSNDRFRAMVYGSYDDLKLILAHPADGDPAIRGGVSSNTVFHRAQLTWQHQYNAAIEHEISVSTGPFSFAQTVGPDLAIQIPGYEGFLRSEWRARLTDQLRLIGGLDVSYNWFNFSYDRSPSHAGRRRSRHLRASHRPAGRATPWQLRLLSTSRLSRGHLADHSRG